MRLEKAKSSAKTNPIAYFHQFDADKSGLTEKSRIELARLIAKESPKCLAKNIRKLEISDERSKIELALSVVENNPEELALHIQDFTIFNEDANIELAHIVAKKKPASLISHIQDFTIFNKDARIELAHIVIEKEPFLFALHIQKFAISDENARIKFAKIIAEKSASTLAKNIQNFKISNESARIELANIVAEKEPDSLVWNSDKFEIASEKARIELAQTIVRKHLSISLINNAYFEKLRISNQAARGHLYASVYLGLIAKGKMSAADEAWINKFFPRDLEFMQLVPRPMPLAQVVAQIGNHHPVIVGLLKTAEQQPDAHIRETLSAWTQLVSLRFAADQLPEATWQDLKALLEAIQKWRAPIMRYVLTHLLAQQCLPPEAKDANAFFAFCKQFTKPHTHLYPALLFALFQTAPADSTLQSLVTLLHRQEFKDIKRQTAVINALLALLQADCLSDELKRLLLQAALLNSRDRKAACSLTETAQVMEFLASLAQHCPEFRDDVLQRLKSIQNPDDFNKQMNEVLKGLFPTLSNAQDMTTCFKNYRKQARHPTAIFNYVIKLKNSLPSYEKTAVLATIDQFINAAVLSPHPVKAFQQLRYDPTKSSHLRLLTDKAPTAFSQWQQPCVYQPSAAFLSKTSVSTKQIDIAAYLQQRIVMDRHVPAGTYPLLEQVLAGQKALAAALQEGERQTAISSQVETNLLKLLDEQSPAAQKTGLITQLLTTLPQDQGQLHLDLKDLKELLMSPTGQATKQLSVIDTDTAEDLFLCGTEVIGSCQNIQGDPNLNKALMGYVLDGKYRMLAIKSAKGDLMGRRMLRLLWDELKQQPVLHLERLYHNPGVPEKYTLALVELAQQKARQMKCVLVSHDKTLESSGDYPTPLKAYPTPWPFEYVDAENLGVKIGKGGYELSRAKIVASPH